MASQTRSAGLGQSVVMGTIPWITPTNIYSSNNVYAWLSLGRREVSHYLRATTFGFAIPDGATIDGIVAEFEKKGVGTGVQDHSVKIVAAGFEQGDEKKLAGYWPGSDTYIAHGGSTDLWGLSWIYSDINASNFGVSIAATYGLYEVVAAYIDHVRITVYYTEVALTNMKINIGDTWKDVEEIKINIGDSWKTVTKVQINIGDVWKTIFG